MKIYFFFFSVLKANTINRAIGAIVLIEVNRFLKFISFLNAKML